MEHLLGYILGIGNVNEKKKPQLKFTHTHKGSNYDFLNHLVNQNHNYVKYFTS